MKKPIQSGGEAMPAADMARLARAPSETDFVDMEDFIHDAANMADTLNDVIVRVFGRKPESGVYRVHDHDGHQILFLAGLAVDMARKVEDAYRIAHANYTAAKGGAA